MSSMRSEDPQHDELVANLLAGPVTLTRDEATAVARVRLGSDPRGLDGARTAVLIAILAALAVQLTRLVTDTAGPTQLGGAVIVVLGAVAALITVRHRPGRRPVAAVVGLLLAGALALVLPPFPEGSASAVLVVLHLPVLLWGPLAMLREAQDARGPDGRWAKMRRRLDHARLTGEVGILMVLFALGGAVLLALTLTLLEPVGVTEDPLVGWVLPSGAAGALVIATWLADGGWHGATRIAPLLATVFTPLLAATLVTVTLVHAFARGAGAGGFDRELLVVFDLLLVLVLALVVLGAAVRPEDRPAGPWDLVRLVMIVAAIALDGLVLGAMLGRIGEFGLTPNRVAALGLNLVLLANLTGSVFVSGRALVTRTDLGGLARWQAANLPLLVLWAAVVVVVLPALFGFA